MSLVHAGFVSLVHAGSQVVSSRDHVVQKGEATISSTNVKNKSGLILFYVVYRCMSNGQINSPTPREGLAIPVRDWIVGPHTS